MDRKRAAELLPIIKAFAEGEDIQFRMGDSEWSDLPKEEHLIMSFPAADYEYRVKPKPLELWVSIWPERSYTVSETLSEAPADIKTIHMREVE